MRYSTYNWSPVAGAVDLQWTGIQHRQHARGRRIRRAVAIRHACFRVTARISGRSAASVTSTTATSSANGPMVFFSRATLAGPRASHRGAERRDDELAAGYGRPYASVPTTLEGCFIAPEILDVAEVTDAAYAMLRFGGDERRLFGRIGVRGNIGAALRANDVDSKGGVAFPMPAWYQLAAATPCHPPLAGDCGHSRFLLADARAAGLQQRHRR